MDDQSLKQQQPIVTPAATSQRSPYDVLIRQSKKMGAVATRALSQMGRFLHQQVVLPPREQLITGLGGNKNSSSGQRRPKGDTEYERTHDDIESLKQEVSKSHEILCNVQSVFPVSLFPDRIMMDRTKVTILKRNFFWSADVISFQIQDILNISSSVGPFFGSLTIASRVMSTVDHFTVNNLWKRDATELKRMIQGYVIAKQNEIDTDSLPIEELIETIRELGSDTDEPTGAAAK